MSEGEKLLDTLNSVSKCGPVIEILTECESGILEDEEYYDIIEDLNKAFIKSVNKRLDKERANKLFKEMKEHCENHYETN